MLWSWHFDWTVGPIFFFGFWGVALGIVWIVERKQK